MKVLSVADAGVKLGEAVTWHLALHSVELEALAQATPSCYLANPAARS